MIGAKEILLLLLVVVLLFGRGKISEFMGDVAKGIRSFKKGMSEDEEGDVKADAPKTIEQSSPASQSTDQERTTTRS